MKKKTPTNQMHVPTNKDFLKVLQTIREEKNLDDIQELFLAVITMYGLTTDEVAALLFSLMRVVLHSEPNKELLEQEFAIDITKLSADGILQVQKALLTAYLEKEKARNGKA